MLQSLVKTAIEDLVATKATQYKLLLSESNWNEVINTLDLLEPDWRGYTVEETTGVNWHPVNGVDLEVR